MNDDEFDAQLRREAFEAEELIKAQDAAVYAGRRPLRLGGGSLRAQAESNRRHAARLREAAAGTDLHRDAIIGSEMLAEALDRAADAANGTAGGGGS